jgi:predicted RNA-binding protein (virulence factor B family)
MAEQYEITEQDIESMVDYLHIFHPENATREYAVEILEYLKASYHRLALTDPGALEDLYKAFEQSKSKE